MFMEIYLNFSSTRLPTPLQSEHNPEPYCPSEKNIIGFPQQEHLLPGKSI